MSKYKITTEYIVQKRHKVNFDIFGDTIYIFNTKNKAMLLISQLPHKTYEYRIVKSQRQVVWKESI